MVSLRPTLPNTGSEYYGLFFSENGYLCLISYLLNSLLYEVMRLLILFRNPNYGGNYIEVQHFEDWKLLNIVWPIRRRNAYIFIIYYQTINQKDKLLYTDMKKASLSVCLQKQKFKTTVK